MSFSNTFPLALIAEENNDFNELYLNNNKTVTTSELMMFLGPNLNLMSVWFETFVSSTFKIGFQSSHLFWYKTVHVRIARLVFFSNVFYYALIAECFVFFPLVFSCQRNYFSPSMNCTKMYQNPILLKFQNRLKLETFFVSF